jgi:DNA-directed RNA polymerase specialized sigma subunit
LREIGNEIGLSESGVCRLRARALARIRLACAA